MPLGNSCCPQQCQCACCNVPCLCPVRDCATGLYYYYGITSTNQKVKMQLVNTAGVLSFKLISTVCQLPGPVVATSTPTPPAESGDAIVVKSK